MDQFIKPELGRWKKSFRTGIITLAVFGFAATVTMTILNHMMLLWGRVFRIGPVHEYFSGPYSSLRYPAVVILTVFLVGLVGTIFESDNRAIARCIRLLRLDKLPWAPKIDPKTGLVIRRDQRKFLDMDPVIAIIADKPHVGFVMGDEPHNAVLRDSGGNIIGAADWISFFDPAGLTVVNGKPHPVAKNRTIRVNNSKMEVLVWHQSQGTKKIDWDLQLWPDVKYDLETLGVFFGIKYFKEQSS